MRAASLLVSAVLFFISTPRSAASPPVPEGLGVNIHFTSPQADEMEQLASAGFTVVRMDFDWIRTEKQRGQYDWSEYETLLAALKPHNIGALFILDYANPLYDNNRSPDTDDGRRAFAAWAAAAVKHFAGRGILWEMYNEPNITPFWRPKVNHDDYVKLALEVGKAVRAAAPNEKFIGPACSRVDLPFLETCFKGGLLEYFDAVTVHPYRQLPPETVAEEYRALRRLIAQYAPGGKSIPIYSGEWGYSSVWSGMDDARQGRYLARQWLTNLANDVSLSIWYDWHDDGPDPKEPEHHFGTVALDYQPKPAYIAAKELTTRLRGYRLNKRLFTGPGADDHVLMFSRGDGDDAIYAAWTTASSPRKVRIGDLTIELDQTPKYVTAPPGELTKALAAWERAPLDTIVRAPARVAQQQLSRGQEQVTVDVPFPAEPSIVQRTMAIVTNAVSLTVRPPRNGSIEIELANPSGEAFSGVVAIEDGPSKPVRLDPAQTIAHLTFDRPDPSARTLVRLLDDAGNVLTSSTPARFVAIPLDAQTYAIEPGGDDKVGSKQSIGINGAPVELQALYEFGPGWKYVRVFCRDEKATRVEGKPKRLSMLVQGDRSGNFIRMRFVDSTGQTFQPDGPKLTFDDARFVTFPLDESAQGHWGGARDGVVHYPIRIESILLIDSADRGKTAGQVRMTAPTIVYEDE